MLVMYTHYVGSKPPNHRTVTQVHNITFHLSTLHNLVTYTHYVGSKPPNHRTVTQVPNITFHLSTLHHLGYKGPAKKDHVGTSIMGSY